jgi:hypothetical protein
VENRKLKVESGKLTVLAGRQEVASGKMVFVKVHNSLKVGDTIEIVKPEYDIIKMRVGKIFDSESLKELSEAHGGQNKAVLLEVSNDIPNLSVIRRKKQTII